MDYEFSSEENTYLENIEPKTPRRSLRLKSNRTPAINKSSTKSVLSMRKMPALSENKAESSDISLRSAIKTTFLENSLSSIEEKKEKNMKVKGKGKKRRTKKSRRIEKSKNIHLAAAEPDPDQNILNMTFDKLNSTSSETENNETQISTNKDVSSNNDDLTEAVNSSPLIQKSANSTSHLSDVPRNFDEDQNRLSNTSKILLSNKSIDLIGNAINDDQTTEEEATALKEDKSKSESNKIEEKEESCSEESACLQGPLANAYILANVGDKNKSPGNGNLNTSANPVINISSDESPNIPQNVGPLAGGYGLARDVGEDKNGLVEESINSVNLLLNNSSDETTSEPASKTKNDIEKISTHDIKQERSIKINDNSANLEQCEIQDSVCIKSPKTPVAKENVEQVVSSTPRMRPINITTPGSIKRLQSNNLGSSVSKSYSKKSVTNRISTPFHRSGKMEKKSSEPLKLIETSLAQTEIVTAISAKEVIEKSHQKLRSIRKRSLSEYVRNKKNHHVTFHSPSNVEIPSNGIDQAIQKPISEENKEQEGSFCKFADIC